MMKTGTAGNYKPIAVENLPDLIAIGSSTGGPEALAVILSALPRTLESTIVIVQHLDKEFSLDMVKWLNTRSHLNVRLAPEGGSPGKGAVYVAGTNDHLALTEKRAFHYTPRPRKLLYRPSVDVFFNSIEKNWPGKGTAVLLTGMGKDGARGLYELKKAGWHTIAQDEKTSAVYGMPGAAKKMNAAVDILPGYNAPGSDRLFQA